ncbi:MAG: hypothetical protein JWL92_436 [Candidatus Nomurabacteria bacterium]|nr:hypothetical protein [Candidatus Nomurabacteria bacterium]
MGNQMFQYAVGRALAIKNNVALGLDTSMLLDRTPRKKQFTFREYELSAFTIDAEIVPQATVPFLYKTMPGTVGIYLDYLRRKFLRLSGTEKGTGFDGSILSLGTGSYLSGYWQSEKYFNEIEGVIRKDFSLKVPLSEKAQYVLGLIESKPSISLHVRRGDYVSDKNAHDILGLSPISYYEAAIAVMLEKEPRASFFVFSDDIEWCKNNLTINAEHVFVEDMPGYEHMTLMSKCKHNIIANSSFSWWGAWLNSNANKIVIAPKKWYNNKAFNNDDLIPDHWITL